MLRIPDYIIIVVYFALMIIIGYLYRNFARGAREYFTAGNVMPWWLAGTSYFMVSFSTMLFLIYNEIAYTYGLVAFTITWVHGAIMVAAGMIFAHRWRRARVITPLGFMERRYDRSTHQLFVWSGFPLRLIDNGLRIYATAIVIITALGFARHPNQKAIFFGIIAVSSALFIIYTFLGGQAGVIVSDFVQAIIILVAVCVVTYLCLVPFDSLSAFWDRLPAGHKEWTRPPYDWTFLIFSTLIISFMNYSAGWALVQKYNTVRSEQDARKMVWLVTFLKMITPPLFFLPGLAAVILMPDMNNPRYAFSEMSFSLLPIGLGGFLLAAMFSATTSTVGAEYNTLSGIITRDFYLRVLRPQATDKQQIFIGKIATVVIGLLTMLIAVLIEYIPQLNLMDIMKRTFAAFGPPIFIPLFMGLINRRFNSFGVWLGVIFGASIGFFGGAINIWLIHVFEKEMSDPTVDYWLRGAFTSVMVVTNCLAVLFGMWLGSRLRPMSPETRSRVDNFFKDLDQPFVIDKSLKVVESPFRLIGGTTALFGAAMILVSFLILFVYHNEHPNAFILNFVTALILVALGLGMRYFSPSGRRLAPSDAAESKQGN